MIGDRWRGTRARLRQEASLPDANQLWGRITSSRGAGASVDLPARDPRRPVSPVLLAVAMASIVLLRLIPPPVGPGPDVTDPDVAMMELFTTPAYAQGTGISTLPPVDRLDFSRLVPGRLVSRHAEGAE
jgi:hypothetical protein